MTSCVPLISVSDQSRRWRGRIKGIPFDKLGALIQTAVVSWVVDYEVRPSVLSGLSVPL